MLQVPIKVYCCHLAYKHIHRKLRGIAPILFPISFLAVYGYGKLVRKTPRGMEAFGGFFFYRKFLRISYRRKIGYAALRAEQKECSFFWFRTWRHWGFAKLWTAVSLALRFSRMLAAYFFLHRFL